MPRVRPELLPSFFCRFAPNRLVRLARQNSLLHLSQRARRVVGLALGPSVFSFRSKLETSRGSVSPYQNPKHSKRSPQSRVLGTQRPCDQVSGKTIQLPAIGG